MRSFRASRLAPDPGTPRKIPDPWDEGQDRDRRSKVLAILFLAALALFGGAALVVGLRVTEAGERNKETLCLERGQTPRSVLVLLDTTDPLARDSGSRFLALIERIRERLPRNGRLTVASFGGDVAGPMNLVFDWCSPGQGREANVAFEGRKTVERAYEQRFKAPLDVAARRLVDVPPSRFSPIAEQIERAVNDPAITWAGGPRELVVMSDGLENTEATSVYRTGRVALPATAPDLLKGVQVHFIELANPRSAALQTVQMREAWRQWFEKAGASSVSLYAPGYPPPPGGYGEPANR